MKLPLWARWIAPCLLLLPLLTAPAFAANQLPVIGGPGGPVTSDPVAIINPNGGASCVLGAVGCPGLAVTPSAAAAVPSTNGSTTVTAGGTYQTVFASSTTRKGCTIQNPTTATEILNVRVNSLAVFTVPIGATFNCGSPGGVVISDLIQVTAATTGHAFTATAQ